MSQVWNFQIWVVSPLSGSMQILIITVPENLTFSHALLTVMQLSADMTCQHLRLLRFWSDPI